jgi:hypothetical protein
MQISCIIEFCTAHNVRAMNSYRIIPEENGFQIEETFPDGRRGFIGGFSTEAEAQAWLDSYLRMRGLNRGPLGEPGAPET